MSEAVFSHLPRFDGPADRHSVDWLRPLDAVSAAPPKAPPPEEVSVPAVTAEAPPPSPSAPVGDAAQMRKAIADLSALMGRLELESRQQAVNTIQTMAGRLFPELSRQFMAEEIGRHLPGLVPAAVPGIEIHAPPDLAARLEEMVATQPALAGRCTVIAAEGRAGVNVSWRTGGVTFDFDGLLAACLAQLSPTHNTKVEQM